MTAILFVWLPLLLLLIVTPRESSATIILPTQMALPDAEVIRAPISAEPVPNQVVIRFDPDATAQEREDYIRSIGGLPIQTIDALHTVIVRVSDEVSVESLPETSYVNANEHNFTVGALLETPTNDPLYYQQWALDAINISAAWEQLSDNPETVIVAVIDSGVCNHPDLAGRILSGWDFVENDSIPQDEYNHGCAISGIIAANIGNEVGIAGIAPNAQILPLRVLDANGVGTYANVAQAIIYVADYGESTSVPIIINLSLGGTQPSSLLEDAVHYAQARGVQIVAAAGNNGVNQVLFPAAYPSVIAVGSGNQSSTRSNFSNYGAELDYLAPGEGILSLDINGGVFTRSGTSFAAAHVSGMLALAHTAGSLTTRDQMLVFGPSSDTYDSGGEEIVVEPSSTPIPESSDETDGGDVQIISDGQFVYGPNVENFDLSQYITENLPHLSEYTQIILGRAGYYSINPKIYLTIITMATDSTDGIIANPLALQDGNFEEQLDAISEVLFEAFYWRLYSYSPASGDNLGFTLVDGSEFNMPSSINAGTYALVAVFAQTQGRQGMQAILDNGNPQGFYQTYLHLFPADNPLDTSNQLLTALELPPFEMQFPYPLGESWVFNRVHRNNPLSTGDLTLSSIDFWPDTDLPEWNDDTSNLWVVAAADGTRNTGINSSCNFRINHGGGWQTQYYHLDNVQSFPSGQIRANDRIGNLANTEAQALCGGGQSDGPHVHFSLLRNGAFVPIGGLQLSGWTIQVGNDSNCGNTWMERSGERQCPGSEVPNGDAPSEGNIREIEYTFNTSLLYWPYIFERHDSSLLGFSIDNQEYRDFSICSAFRIWLLRGTHTVRVRYQESPGQLRPPTLDRRTQSLFDIFVSIACSSGPPDTPPPPSQGGGAGGGQSPENPPPNGNPYPYYVVTDISYPEVVSPGQSFRPEVTVCLYNGAQLIGSRGDRLQNIDGNEFRAWPHVQVIGTVNSGQCYLFRFYEDNPIVAPTENGTYTSQWKLWVNDSWIRGTEVVIRFTVGSGESTPDQDVILYDNQNYSGDQRGFGRGRHDIGESTFNDRAHSMTVRGGWSVMLYEHSNFNGAHQCFNQNSPTLPFPFANGVSSLEVFDNPDCFNPSIPPIVVCGGVILHDDGGNFQVITESIPNLAALGWNDRPRWIEAIGPFIATGYDGENYQHFQPGGIGPIENSIRAVGTNVSSVRVEQTQPCDAPIPPDAPDYCLTDSSEWGVYLVKDSGGDPLRLTTSISNLSPIGGGWNDHVSAMYVVGPYRAFAYDDYGWNGSNHGEVNEGSGTRQNLGTNVSSIRVELRTNCANPPRPPAAPVDFNFSATPDSITLSWNNVVNEQGYNVYKWNGTEFVFLAQLGTDVTTYTDDGLNCAQIYYYQVRAYNTVGESTPTHVEADCVPNDSPETATTIDTLPSASTQPTGGARMSDGSPIPLCGFNVGSMVWYRYTAPGNGIVHISTEGTDYDTVLAVFTGPLPNLTEVICNDDEGVVEGEGVGATGVKAQAVGDFIGLTSSIDLPATAGTTYYIMVGGYNQLSGNLVLTITPNTAPQLTVDVLNIEVNEGQSTFNGGVIFDQDGDTVALSASIGTVTNNGDNTWSWSFITNDGPTENQQVTITADDGSGGIGQVTFTLVVNNVAPTATFANTSGAIEPGQSAQLVFTNPFDPSPIDTAAGFLYSFDCTNDGTFEVVDTTSPSYGCPYASAGNFTALGRIKDTNGGYTDYTVTVTVMANNPPIAVGDSVIANQDAPIAISVLVNDTDPDGDPLTIASVGPVTNGTAAQTDSGIVTYTPLPNYIGPDSFSYTISDGRGGTSTAVVNITVDHLAACNTRDLRADLSGVITNGGTTGNITNNGPYRCYFEVGMAAYRKFDEVIDNQELFDGHSQRILINPGETITLSVTLPDCAVQVDLFYGPLLPHLNGQRYDARLITVLHLGDTNYCQRP